MSGPWTGAVIATGRSVTARPRFFTQPNSALSGTESTPRTSSSRAHPTTTSVPPGASSARNRARVSAKGRWCSTATQVMTSYGPGGSPSGAAARVYRTFAAAPPCSRARSRIPGSESTASTRSARPASSRASSPAPHPTSSARPDRGGNCRSSQGW